MLQARSGNEFTTDIKSLKNITFLSLFRSHCTNRAVWSLLCAWALFTLSGGWSLTAWAADFLPPEQAFAYEAKADAHAIVVTYNIHTGYYLYRQRISFATKTPDVSLGAPEYPSSSTHHDAYFGDQQVYRETAVFRIPYTSTTAPTAIDLNLKLQGCADQGLCYPPQTWTAHLIVPAANAAPTTSLLARLTPKTAASQKPFGSTTTDFLAPDAAFQLSAEGIDTKTVALHFNIADGYYLYKQRVHVSATDERTTISSVQLPVGLGHDDEYFGKQEIYRQQAQINVAYALADMTASTVTLTVSYQGCADAGLCYPPIKRTLNVARAALTATTTQNNKANPGSPPRLSEQDQLASLVSKGSLWLIAASFFGFGLVLAFTPCVLPMIPILSGIIAGDSDTVTPLRGFVLSLAYVLGMAMTYTIAGAVFALAGRQAQAVFQQTWIIVLFAGLFVALAFAMFGAYELQMPASVQTRLSSFSNRLRGGRLISSMIMGALSSLIVSACVAPPLVAALSVIGQSGSVARGALALFALSLGMGAPLLAVGASAGTLLPKAGPWMTTVKALFGVLFLGVAAWMLDRLLGPRTMLLVWALVLLTLFWVIMQVGLRGNGRSLLRVSVGCVVSLMSAALVLCAALNADPWHPFASRNSGAGPSAKMEFRVVHGEAELDAALSAANRAGRRTLVDVYADWCVSCKEMEARTFSDPAIKQALANYVLLKADVTQNTPADQRLLHRFGIIGPPTTAFFASDGEERRAFRLVGFVAASAFHDHLTQFESLP
jgi:thiol:disulfide interchange protein DsbD